MAFCLAFHCFECYLASFSRYKTTKAYKRQIEKKKSKKREYFSKERDFFLAGTTIFLERTRFLLEQTRIFLEGTRFFLEGTRFRFFLEGTLTGSAVITHDIYV